MVNKIGWWFLLGMVWLNNKGYTSFKLREEFPELKSRLPCMWTRSYYAGSVGHVSEATVKKYIENQKNV